MDWRAHNLLFTVKHLSLCGFFFSACLPTPKGWVRRHFLTNAPPPVLWELQGEGTEKVWIWTARNCSSMGCGSNVGGVLGAAPCCHTVQAAISLLAVPESWFWAGNIPLKYSRVRQAQGRGVCHPEWRSRQKENYFLEKRKGQRVSDLENKDIATGGILAL